MEPALAIDAAERNRAKLLTVDCDEKSLRECLRAVLEAQDSPDDITQGANHYLGSPTVRQQVIHSS